MFNSFELTRRAKELFNACKGCRSRCDTPCPALVHTAVPRFSHVIRSLDSVGFHRRTLAMKKKLALIFTAFVLTYLTLIALFRQRRIAIKCQSEAIVQSDDRGNVCSPSIEPIKLSMDLSRRRTACPLPDCPRIISGEFNHGIPKKNFHFPLDERAECSELRYLQVERGGSWQPADCNPVYEPVAVIVPLRNRHRHLQLFLSRIHLFLQQQKIPYVIVTVNQTGNDEFNRGALFNVGVLSVPNSVNCFVLTDVDMMPDQYDNLFTCNQTYPKHMSPAISKYNYRLIYHTNFGGMVSFTREQFVKINGFSTSYWGWGGEDDDLYKRVVKHFKRIDRVPMSAGRVTHFDHFKNESGTVNPERFKLLGKKYNYSADGLSTTPSVCVTLHIEMYRLRTDVVVKCSRNKLL